MAKSNLYGWLFTYNPYQNKWSCAKRDNYADMFSDRKSKQVYSSTKIETLIEIITKTDFEEHALSDILTGVDNNTNNY